MCWLLLWGQDLKRVIWATALIAAAFGMTGVAMAAPGQCEFTGYPTFDCDVALDGNGLTFALPDGQTFAFTLEEGGAGLAFLIAPDAGPGQRPDELGEFVALADRPGCWARDEDYQFCVLVQQ